MKQTIWDGKEVLLVEVPEDCIRPDIIGRKVVDSWADEEWSPFATLPEGDWQFAFASPLSPTEVEAGEWVEATERPDFDNNCEMVVAGHPNYNGDGLYDTAIESLHSRIRSEGFPYPERVVLLTKKG